MEAPTLRTSHRPQLGRLFFVLALAATAGFSNPAKAFDQQIDLQLVRPGSTETGALAVPDGTVGFGLRLSGGIYGIYLAEPISLRSTDFAAQVDYKFDLAFALRADIFGLVAVSLDMPISLATAGLVVDETNLVQQEWDLSEVGAGPGDMRLAAKGQLLRAESHFVDLAVGGDLVLPTGGKEGFMGGPGVRFSAISLSARFPSMCRSICIGGRRRGIRPIGVGMFRGRVLTRRRFSILMMMVFSTIW